MDPAHDRGVVLQFRGTRKSAMRPGGLLRSHPPVAAELTEDAKLNAEWDLLIRVASHAWSWRDPESLDTLEHAVTRLRSWVARDWSA